MSVNVEAMRQIELLMSEYEQIYGREPDIQDFSLPGLTQEKMVIVLRRMIDESESLIVAYKKVYGK